MSDIFGPASVAAGQALSSFGMFLPKLSDIRKADPDDGGMVGDVRLGEVAACAVTLGVGSVASSLSRSPVPLYAAVFVAAILVCVYESALRGNQLFTPVRGGGDA